jgi:ribosomal protein S12 methylthiotransferase
MGLQKRLVRQTQKSRIGRKVRLLVDGPAREHDLVLRARLEGQAPDIDPLVYLTECDPAELSPGDFIQAEIVAAREYDLVARPLPPVHRERVSATASAEADGALTGGVLK